MPAEEAALVAFVARRAADLFDHEQDRIAVAIDPDVADMLNVAAFFPLALKYTARPVATVSA
jgi:hypothetical protein